jgi:hypothetical protein
MAVNLTNRIKAMAAPRNPFRALIRDEEGLKPAREVKAAVNYLRLPSGNRLTVPDNHARRDRTLREGPEHARIAD